MILGALVDAGLPFETLRDQLAGLRLPGYTLERREVMKGAFRATKVEVRIHREADHHQPHPHRNLEAILRIIDAAELTPAVKETASKIFKRLALAEGRAHGVPPERVEFHDVGAVDAIVDITGSCIGLDWLQVGGVHCSALPIGGGMVRGPHGLIPVPAPGTAEL